ncbi:MICOS complex subunit mic25a-like [Leguminivora glycinivorella]|uniref:MICOS complex subunit mic25a-like n=1 Tax=Leguminivora glycinivorella TaxID=1035111 RepID=UPI00200CD886|nr:MICOS complex subunit mic25a-like [Leguminivora glycinivorella]
MGSGQSVRTSHFTRQAPPADEDPHISISNKMVERLVEDAALAGGAAVPPVIRKPREDLKDKILNEKMTCLDETHSERSKITVDDINSLVRRIEMRSSNLPSVDPVCPDYQQRIIDCYNEGEEGGDVVRCWNTIGEFSQCVAAAGAARLQASRLAPTAQARRHNYTVRGDSRGLTP